MKLRLSIGVALIALLPTPEARSQVVSFAPQVVSGFNGPEDARFFMTEFSFLNLSGTTTVSVVLELLQDDGSPFPALRPIPPVPGPGTVGRVEFSLSPRGTERIETAPNSSFPLVGWARVESSKEIAWGATLQYRDALSGGVITSTSVLPEPLTHNFTTIVFISRQGGPRIGIALLNPSDTDSAETEVRLFNLDGSLRDVRTITLEPLEKIAQFFDEGDLFVDLDTFRGSAEVSSTIPLAVTVIRLDETYWSSLRTFPPFSQ